MFPSKPWPPLSNRYCSECVCLCNYYIVKNSSTVYLVEFHVFELLRNNMLYKTYLLMETIC